MSYKNIYISNPAELSVKNGQLIVSGDEKKIVVPIEDIDALLLENNRSTISVATLSKLGVNKVAVFVCDEKHLPIAVMLPFSQHSRQLRIERMQLDASKPLKKQIWKDIVKRKIRNQAKVLDVIGEDDTANVLISLADRTMSGDKDNCEGIAARKYFTALFGDNFVRRDEDEINAALNYGYAIIRGAIARSIATRGLIPSIGVHHRSELNGFNLADDIIEPFRPVVDLYVFNNASMFETKLGSEAKAGLLNLLNAEVNIDNKMYSISSAINLVIDSLIRSFEAEKCKIILPSIVRPQEHKYG